MSGPIPVYLAGPSREHERVCRIAALLGRAGSPVFVTDHWFADAHVWAGMDATHSPEDARYMAENHELAIIGSKIFWLLWPKGVSHGAAYELGYASGLRDFRDSRNGQVGPRIIVSGEGCAGSIYTSRADYRSESDESALAEVLRVAAGLRGA